MSSQEEKFHKDEGWWHLMPPKMTQLTHKPAHTCMDSFLVLCASRWLVLMGQIYSPADEILHAGFCDSTFLPEVAQDEIKD